MNAVKTLLMLGLLLLPCASFAEDCQVVEFPDHFEATCIGDAKPYSIPRAEIAGMSGRAADPAPGDAVQQEASHNPGGSAAAVGIEPARAPEPGAAGPGRRGRQGRPSTADLNAVLEARRRLIQQSSPPANQ